MKEQIFKYQFLPLYFFFGGGGGGRGGGGGGWRGEKINLNLFSLPFIGERKYI